MPFILRRNPKADVRVVIAAAYIGLGTVWHGGLSGSAPLILATPGNPLLAPASGPPVVDRLVPVTDGDRTFWQWESRFDTRAGEAAAMTKLVGEEIYEAGFAAIRQHMGLN